jgi:hypothetical protein
LTVEKVQGASGVRTKLALIAITGEAQGNVGGNSKQKFQNVSITVIKDLPIPSTGLPTSFEGVYPYLENVQPALSACNDRKGVPQVFVLTCSSKFQNSFEIPF